MMVFLSCTLFVKEGRFLDDALIVEVRSTKKIGDLQLAFLVYGKHREIARQETETAS